VLRAVARSELRETANEPRHEAWEAVGPRLEATARSRCPQDHCTEEAVFRRTVDAVACHMGSQGDGHDRPDGGTYDIRIVALGPMKRAPFAGDTNINAIFHNGYWTHELSAEKFSSAGVLRCDGTGHQKRSSGSMTRRRPCWRRRRPW